MPHRDSTHVSIESGTAPAPLDLQCPDHTNDEWDFPFLLKVPLHRLLCGGYSITANYLSRRKSRTFLDQPLGYMFRQRPTVGCLTSPGGALRFTLRKIPILPSLPVCVFHPTALWQNAKSACIAMKSSTACVLAPNILNSISYTHTRI